MKIQDLQRIKKEYFGFEDIAAALKISRSSAKVSANRYARNGILIRLKRNMYVLADNWRAISAEGRFVLANMLQSPSYISLATALQYHNITTQMQRGFVESVAVRRTKEIRVAGVVFRFTKIKKALYSGFVRNNNFFIASPEKAFLDAAYLASFQRYRFDEAALDYRKLDRRKVEKLAGAFPDRTRTYIKRLYERFAQA